MDFSRAAIANYGTAPHGVDANQDLLPDTGTGSAPRLSSRPSECHVSLLPDELVREVLGHVGLDDLVSASRVCRLWHAVEESAGWVASMRSMSTWSIKAGSAPMTASAFNQELARTCALSAGCRAEALERLAGKLPCLPTAHWKECLFSLLLQAARCPTSRFYRILAAAASARVTRDGDVNAWNNPGMSIMELVTEVLRLVMINRFPDAAEAMVLAAAYQYIKPAKYTIDVAQLTVSFAKKLSPAQIDKEDVHSIVRRLWELGTQDLPPRSLHILLSRFNRHCLPFMTNAYPGNRSEEEVFAFASAIMRMDMDRRERLTMLLHPDFRGIPWLFHACMDDRPRQIQAYVGAMKRLGLSTAQLAHLFAARNLSGRPLLSMLFCRAVESGSMDEVLNWIDILINEVNLPEAETVEILRSQFRRKPDAEFKDRDAVSSHFPDFAIGPSRAMPFNGLSVIDSLFCDWLASRMEAYMKRILASSLSDAAKRDVLRLDFPDRSDFRRMTKALHTYGDVIRNSSLPSPMKRELTSPLRTGFDPICSLV